MSLTIDSIPELGGLTKSERWRLLGKCHLLSFLHWKTWAGLLAAVLMAVAGQLFVRYVFPQLTERTAPLWGTSGAVLGWLIGGRFSWVIRVGVVRKLIRKKLPHLCPACGYDLRATPERCPECGADYTQSLARPTLPLAA